MPPPADNLPVPARSCAVDDHGDLVDWSSLNVFNHDLADGPEGLKWYVRSGDFRFVVDTVGGPREAAVLAIRAAARRSRESELGRFLFVSQRGFDQESNEYFSHTRSFAERAGVQRSALKGIPE